MASMGDYLPVESHETAYRYGARFHSLSTEKGRLLAHHR